MEKRAKQLEYLITSMILLGIGMLFFFMNESVNTYTVLRFGLFQIMQSVLLLICAILLWYRAYVVRREQETAEGGAETLGAAPAAPEEAGEARRADLRRVQQKIILFFGDQIAHLPHGGAGGRGVFPRQSQTRAQKQGAKRIA